MANKKNFVGMLVMVMVFGMTVVGCDNGSISSSETNVLDTFNFSTATPSNAVLAAGNLTMAQYNQIRESAGGGFKGWTTDIDGDLQMAWTGRSSSNFISVANILENIRGENDRVIAGPMQGAEGNNYYIEFYPAKLSQGGGLYVPAGTLFLDIW